MRVLSRSFRATALAALLTVIPVTAHAQTSMTVACDAGVGCSTLQFNLFSTTALSLDNLRLNLSGGVWRFIPAGGPGSYIASDSYGAFGGFTDINAGGTSAFMDFTGGVAFPFELLAGATGFFQLEGLPANTDDLVVEYVGGIVGGGEINGRFVFGGGGNPNVIPEPATVVLLASGMLALGIVARRRRLS